MTLSSALSNLLPFFSHEKHMHQNHSWMYFDSSFIKHPLIGYRFLYCINFGQCPIYRLWHLTFGILLGIPLQGVSPDQFESLFFLHNCLPITVAYPFLTLLILYSNLNETGLFEKEQCNTETTMKEQATSAVASLHFVCIIVTMTIERAYRFL